MASSYISSTPAVALPAHRPDGRRRGAAVGLPGGGRVFTWGGFRGDGDTDPSGEIWLFESVAIGAHNYSGWRLETPPVSTAPAPRGFCAAAAAGRSAILVFGGATSATAAATAPLGDTWIFDMDARAWYQVTATGGAPEPPPRRCRAGAAASFCTAGGPRRPALS
jgi:hypothetical protein